MRKIDRNSYEYRKWKADVVERDGHKCVRCGETRNLEAHHIMPYAKFPELATNLDNGITLCRKCHSQEHNKNYGKDQIIYDKIKETVHPFFIILRNITFYISYRSDIVRKFWQELPIPRAWKAWIEKVIISSLLLGLLILVSFVKEMLGV